MIRLLTEPGSSYFLSRLLKKQPKDIAKFSFKKATPLHATKTNDFIHVSQLYSIDFNNLGGEHSSKNLPLSQLYAILNSNPFSCCGLPPLFLLAEEIQGFTIS